MKGRVWPPELRVALREGLELRLRRAGLASRALAWALDACLLVAAMEIATVFLFGVGRLSTPLERAILVATGFVFHWAYGTLSEWRYGTTVGKRMLGLFVIDARGGRPSLRRTFARNLLRTLDALPGLWLVGGAAAWWSRGGARLGDRAAKTAVVCFAPGPTRVHGGPLRGAPSVASHLPPPSVVASASHQGTPTSAERTRGRGALSPDELRALGLLLGTREGLPLGARDALFEQLGRHLAIGHRLERPHYRTWESVLLDLAQSQDIGPESR